MHSRGYDLITGFFAGLHGQMRADGDAVRAGSLRELADGLAHALAWGDRNFDLIEFWHQAFPGFVPPYGEWRGGTCAPKAGLGWQGAVAWLECDGAGPEHAWLCRDRHPTQWEALACGQATAGRRNRLAAHPYDGPPRWARDTESGSSWFGPPRRTPAELAARLDLPDASPAAEAVQATPDAAVLHRQDYSAIAGFFAAGWHPRFPAGGTAAGAAFAYEVALAMVDTLAGGNSQFDVIKFWRRAFPGKVPPGGLWRPVDPVADRSSWKAGVAWIAGGGAEPESGAQCGHQHSAWWTALECGQAEANRRNQRRSRPGEDGRLSSWPTVRREFPKASPLAMPRNTSGRGATERRRRRPQPPGASPSRRHA